MLCDVHRRGCTHGMVAIGRPTRGKKEENGGGGGLLLLFEDASVECVSNQRATIDPAPSFSRILSCQSDGDS